MVNNIYAVQIKKEEEERKSTRICTIYVYFSNHTTVNTRKSSYYRLGLWKRYYLFIVLIVLFDNANTNFIT